MIPPSREFALSSEPPPSLPEAVSFELRCHSESLQRSVVAVLDFDRRDMLPINSSSRRLLNQAAQVAWRTRRTQRSPWSGPMDDLGLEGAVDGLGESVVVGISDAADGGPDAGFGKAFGVAYADILSPCRNDAPAAPVDESTFVLTCSRASRTRLAWAVMLPRQPTMRRA